MDDEKPAAAGGQASPVTGDPAPPLLVRIQGSGWSLPAGPSYLIGRYPGCDIVVADGRVSWRHAVLRLEEGRWILADNGSTNGIYAGDRRVSRVEINGQAVIRLSHPYDGPAGRLQPDPWIRTRSGGSDSPVRDFSSSIGSQRLPFTSPERGYMFMGMPAKPMLWWMLSHQVQTSSCTGPATQPSR